MGTVIEFQPEPTPERSQRRSTPLWRHLVGAYLRRVRLEQERILTEVAREAGVSPQYLSEIERGRKEPSSEILDAVAVALGVTLLDITRGVAAQLREERTPVTVTSIVSTTTQGDRSPVTRGSVQLAA